MQHRPASRRAFSSLTIALVLAYAGVGKAALKEIGPGDDLKTAVGGLVAGDELVLKGGTYSLTGYFGVTLEGTQAAPIVIRAKAGEKVHVERPAADQNIVDFVKARFLTIQGIEFSGGSRGLRMIDVSDTTIQDCEVHHTDDVAISANDTGKDYARVSLLRNHIHDTSGTGEGMYLGCNDNGCQFHDALIAANYIHHTNGPNVDQGDGIEIKEGSYANVVRDNVIHDTGYPCILTYSTVGNGGPNVLERNVMWGCGDHGIQSAADVIIRNNIILGAAANGIANQPHQAGTPSNIQIVHNTIIAPLNHGITSSGITGSVLIANNAIYTVGKNAIQVGGSLGQVVVKNNVGVGGLIGVATGLVAGNLANDLVNANTTGKVPNDVFPKAGGALVGAGDVTYVVPDDFNGTARGAVADVGAYKFAAAGNPGWALAESFKAAVAGTNPDGGVSLDASANPDGAGGTGSGGDAAANGLPANTDGGATGSDDTGCGCRTTSRANDTSSAFGLGAALALALALRARRRTR